MSLPFIPGRVLRRANRNVTAGTAPNPSGLSSPRFIGGAGTNKVEPNRLSSAAALPGKLLVCWGKPLMYQSCANDALKGDSLCCLGLRDRKLRV